MKASHRFVAFLGLFIIIAGCMSSEALLRKRIEEHYAGLNPKIMWELSAEDFRKRMSEKEYIEYFEKHNYFKEFKDVVFSIEEVSISGNKARVKMRIQAKTITDNTKIDEILYDYWVFEYNNWYMKSGGRTE